MYGPDRPNCFSRSVDLLGYASQRNSRHYSSIPAIDKFQISLKTLCRLEDHFHCSHNRDFSLVFLVYELKKYQTHIGRLLIFILIVPQGQCISPLSNTEFWHFLPLIYFSLSNLRYSNSRHTFLYKITYLLYKTALLCLLDNCVKLPNVKFEVIVIYFFILTAKLLLFV